MEGRIETGTQHSKSQHSGSKGKKLSSTSYRTIKNMVSDSESSDDESMPSLSCMRKSEKKSEGNRQ